MNIQTDNKTCSLIKMQEKIKVCCRNHGIRRNERFDRRCAKNGFHAKCLGLLFGLLASARARERSLSELAARQKTVAFT